MNIKVVHIDKHIFSVSQTNNIILSTCQQAKMIFNITEIPFCGVMPDIPLFNIGYLKTDSYLTSNSFLKDMP